MGLTELLAVEAPQPRQEYEAFWKEKYSRSLLRDPDPHFEYKGEQDGWIIQQGSFRGSDGVALGAWLLLPKDREIRQALIVSHGYGGRSAPDFHLPFPNAALLFPCSRGISLSRLPGIPEHPQAHVLMGIEDPERYIIGSCAADLWLSVSAMEQLFPELRGHMGFLGISFGGGLVSMALPWESRVSKGHVQVPTFGHQRLRLRLPTVGSGHAVHHRWKQDPQRVEHTLSYHDAAISARFLRVPMHFACALFDPAVAPPGQYAIYNATPGGLRHLFVLEAGHFSYPKQDLHQKELLQDLAVYFQDL